MKSIVIVPLLFLCIFAQAHKNNLVDRIYPSIDNVDTINVNCMIIQKNKPQKQIMKLLSVVEGTQDTILIVADKSEYKTFKLGKTYSLSLAMVRRFTYTIVRNGYILQAVFDRDTKYATSIPYINKVKPALYILLMNNGIITLKKQHPNDIRDCFESRRLKFVDSFSPIVPEAGAVWDLELPNKCDYTYDASGTKLKAEYLLSDVRFMDWDDAAISDGDAALQTGGTGLPVVGPGGDARPMPPGSEVIVEPVTLTTVEYSGGHVYRNGRLERVGNSYGYWADSTFHYHITDYQGNIRAVIAGDGTLEEVNNYYPYGGLMGTAGTGVQPHKYGAKELDRENGLDLYDSHARWYDPLLARTTTQDPLAEKYRHLSPYAWCAANPIKYIDPNGCEPTFKEAARIAAHVYGDQEDDILIGGWKESKLKPEIKYNNSKSGFKSKLYERVVDGIFTEYVYATAGTDKDDISDWLSNALQTIGLSYQYLESGKNAKLISEALSNSELNYVGHSMGGGQAALNSILTSSESLKGRKAFTFNAAGVSDYTKLFVGGVSALLKSENKINAYITTTDPLNIIQNNNLNCIGKALPDVNGKRHYVPCQSIVSGHSIMKFINISYEIY